MNSDWPTRRGRAFVAQAAPVLDEETYSFLQVKPDTKPPAQALVWFAARDDATLVMPTSRVSKAVPRSAILARDDGWRRITLRVKAPTDVAGLLGAFADALGEAGVSIMSVGGYSYDHVFVQEEDVERALKVIDHVVDTAERIGAAAATSESG